MSKYLPLKHFLEGTPLDRVQMSFKEIEQVLRFKLPASALKHRPWWSNSGGAHVQSDAWLDAGFETESVDMDSRRLVFRRRSRDATRMAAAPKPEGSAPGIDKVYGCLSGTVIIRGDFTKPVDETWSAEEGRL